MNGIRKIVFLVTVMLGLYCTAFAQTDTVRIRVIGLTCSSCSKSVEEKLIQVQFVKSVHMNLNRNEATILVDFSKQVNWNILAKAVYDAGFSVGAFLVPSCKTAVYKMNNHTCADNYFFAGDAAISELEKPYYTLIGKKFMDRKLYNAWQQKLSMQGNPDPSSVTYYYYY
jgi:copper chaperone CopZ